MPKAPPDSNAIAFLLEEQKQRRAEMERMIAAVDGDQRNMLLASGAIWSWLALQRASLSAPFVAFGLLIPVVLSSVFFLRSLRIEKSLRRVARYTMRLERRLGLPKSLGWENWVRRVRSRRQTIFEMRLQRLADNRAQFGRTGLAKLARNCYSQALAAVGRLSVNSLWWVCFIFVCTCVAAAGLTLPAPIAADSPSRLSGK